MAKAFEYMIPSAGSARKTSVTAPSLLIDDLELYAPEEEQPKLPIVPPPEIVH